MNLSVRHAKIRTFKASWRDTVLLLREFRRPLFLFILAMISTGAAFSWLSALGTGGSSSLVKSIYIVLGLTFLQPIIDFPAQWYLQIFFFMMPIIGIGILAQGLADFGVMLFNRRARSKEWEMAVASTFNNHVLLVGMGHLGFRVVKKLHEMEREVVVITLDPGKDLSEKVRAMGIPVIIDDATRESVLEAAGIRRAQTIILCTQNDVLNLQIAVKARSLKQEIHVVIRIFEDEFAQALQQQFGFQAFSATSMAAPIFAAAALDIDMTPPIYIAGQPNSLAKLSIPPLSKLVSVSVETVEKKYTLSIVALERDQQQRYHPSGDILLEPEDTIVILGRSEHISALGYDIRN